MKIKGKYAEALVLTENIDEASISQLYDLMNDSMFEGQNVVIQPDVHAGVDCVIGFTSTYNKSVLPQIIGNDIGCGVMSMNIGKVDSIDFEELDKHIRENLVTTDAEYNFGTIGGGNHFVELGKDSSGDVWITVHTGSRSLGARVYKTGKSLVEGQRKHAKKVLIDDVVDIMKKEGKHQMIEGYIKMIKSSMTKESLALNGPHLEIYLREVSKAVDFAVNNRTHIASSIAKFLGKETPLEVVDTPHNYIDVERKIIYKGAVAVHDKPVAIPISMKDGVFIVKASDDEDRKKLNYAGPHGAGRVLSRSKAKEQLDMKDFEESMVGIFSNSISESTLDEAPMAYKSVEDIIPNLRGLEVINHIKPIFSFKSP